MAIHLQGGGTTRDQTIRTTVTIFLSADVATYTASRMTISNQITIEENRLRGGLSPRAPSGRHPVA